MSADVVDQAADGAPGEDLPLQPGRVGVVDGVTARVLTQIVPGTGKASRVS
jgi:hypothetical protein